jgi:acyl dehydratase
MGIEQIAKTYGFTSRQSGYYLNAGIYLGLVQRTAKNTSAIETTDEGKAYAKMGLRDGQIYICERLLMHQIFRDMFEILLETGRFPDPVQIEKMVIAYSECTGKTVRRRSQSVTCWLRWMINLTESSI